MTASNPSTPRWFALPLLALGIIGFAAAWTLLALRYDGPFAWLAPLAAIDMVLLLGFARHSAGGMRAGWAVVATAATVVLANFGIIAGQVGLGMGLLPWESAMKLGPAYAWELARLSLRPVDLAWHAFGLAVAMLAGYRTWSTRRGAGRA